MGVTVTEGFVIIGNRGRFPVTLDDVRPLPSRGAKTGLPVTAIELLRYRLAREGTWVYRGYEVTYRSGFVRHKTVLDLTAAACAPESRFPQGCELHD